MAAGIPAEAQSLCGNGRIDAGETCEDGNLADGDCCSSSCQLTTCPAPPAPIVSWEEIGPRSVGGRVSALAVDPSDAQHLLVGTPAGGLWRSHDGGASWTGVAPWLAAVPISAVAIHPTNGDVAVAGTGEISDGGSVRKGVGIVRTTDGGLSWSLAPSVAPPYIAALLIWTQEPDRVLAATDVGVLLSTDGAASFTESLRGDGISALVRDPFDANAVYAAGRASLFRSADRGRTWTRLASWPLLADDKQGAGTVALAVSHQTAGLMYATVQVLAGFDQTDRALFLKSTDGGTTFAPVGSAPDFCPTESSCGFAQAVALDPADDRRLLIGGDRLYVSTDAATTWSALAGTAGIHEVSLHAGGAYAAGTSGVTSIDVAWANASARNEGLAVASIVDLDVSKESPPRLLASTHDTGTVLGTGGGSAWSVVFGAREPAGPARFDPFAPGRLYASKPQGRLWRSDDGGTSFAPITTGLDMTQRAAALAPFEPNLFVPGTLYTGRSQVAASFDTGASWAEYRPLGSPEVSQIAVSPVDPDRVYFALASGPTVYKADDIHTEILQPTTDPDIRIESIFLDPDAENVLYVTGTNSSTQAGRIFKSYDFGATWDDLTPPALAAARSIVKDPFGALYVGTAEGVWRSANDGFTWAPFKSGLLASGVTRLRVADGFLYAGTTGRGVFRAPARELVSIDSIPPGMKFVVDGALVAAPIFDAWGAGTSHTVRPYLLQTADTRQEFVSWSDGGAATHTVNGTGGNLSLTAAIRESYRLQANATPSVGGTVTPEPGAAENFYPSQTFVSAVAAPADDHRFVRWTGDLNGSQDILGFALMDRPRRITAEFAPLNLVVQTNPPGLPLDIDGQTVGTPASYRWATESAHSLAAPDVVDLDPSDPAVLAFDHWSDLLPRAHTFTMLRDTFITDLTAEYVTTVPSLQVLGGGGRVVRTPGKADAPRVAALSLSGGAAVAPETAAVLSGTIEGMRITELVLVPTAAREQVHTFIEGGGVRGRTRIVVHNTGAAEATVSLLLRDAGGVGLVARPEAFHVAPNATFIGDMQDLILLPPTYEGLLSVISDQPVYVSVQSRRENLRSSTFLDPIVVAPFTEADRNVPADPRVLVLLRTPDTEHRVVLFNPAFAALSGIVRAFDESGAPLAFADGASAVTYGLPAGGHQMFRFHLPAPSGGSGALRTARLELTPDAPHPAPQVQLVEERVVGQAPLGQGDQVLPRTVPPSRSGLRFVVPVDGERRDSGVVLTNRGASAVTATLQLRTLTGDVVDTAVLTVPAGGQSALLASEVFPLAATLEGTLHVTTSSLVAGVGVLRSVNARGEEILAGWPAFDGAPASTLYHLPYVVDGDSWSSHLWMSGGEATVTAQFDMRGADGSVIRLPMVWP